ncbi:MAG: ROK family protein [Succinivibrio sp.]|nr:ROK family protein [Succinivibrio sp.]
MEILGVDIGGTGIKGAVVDTATGDLLTERVRIETPQPATPTAICDTLKKLVDTIGYKGPIGCGFPSRITRGVVKTASNIDKSWVNVPVEKLFSEKVGAQVFVANDADVAGLCELRLGAGKDSSGVVLFLTFGTGIGSAIFVNGQLYPNTELGQIKFKGDVAEHYCSGLVREKEDLKWKEWGNRVNEYLTYIDYLLKPDVILLGGGVSKKFEKYAEKLTLETPVKPGEYLNLAGIIGAALYGEACLAGNAGL